MAMYILRSRLIPFNEKMLGTVGFGKQGNHGMPFFALTNPDPGLAVILGLGVNLQGANEPLGYTAFDFHLNVRPVECST